MKTTTPHENVSTQPPFVLFFTEILREYLKSKTGLPYAGKHMTVEMIEESRLVYFKKKVYIPDRLRRKTVKYYCHAYPDTPKETIRENCIWPEMDQDMDNYLQRM